MKNFLEQIASQYQLQPALERLGRLEEPLELAVGFLGEFSTGKSTLINAMLGRKVLPAMDRPTTGSITEVHPQEGISHLSFLLREPDGTTSEISAAEFSDVAAGEKPGIAIVKAPPSELLLGGYRIVDTPGISALDKTHLEITYGHLPFLDGAVICIDINKGGIPKSVIDFLQRDAIAPLRDRFIFAITRADQKGAKAGDAIRSAVIAELSQSLNMPTQALAERVVLVSGEAALSGDPAALTAFAASFTTAFVAPRRALIAERTQKELASLAEDVLCILTDRLENLTLDDDALRQKESELKNALVQVKNRRKSERQRLATIIGELRQRLDAVTSRHLAAFEDATEDTVKERSLALSEDINSTIASTISASVEGLELPDYSHMTAPLRRRIERISKTVDAGKTAATAMAIAALSGGTSVAANAAEAAAGATGKQVAQAAAKETVKQAAKTASTTAVWLQKGARVLGQVIEHANPINYLGDFIGDTMKEAHAREMLGSLSVNVASEVEAELRDHFDRQIFAEVEAEITEKIAAQDSAWQIRKQTHDALERERDELRRVIRELESKLGSNAGGSN